MIDLASYKVKILITIALLITTVILKSLSKRAILRFGTTSAIDMNSRKIIFYLNNVLFYGTATVVTSLIWSVNLEDFSLFISSTLAILGVSFVAQWSLLSNLTASVILFFKHPLRLGDRIRVMDKDFEWIGKVEDINGFYLFMKTDDGRKITIPTNLVIQKGIEILHNEPLSEETKKKIQA